MPVESRDDLVKRLQRRTQRCGTEHGIPVFERVPICLEAATRIASDAKRIAELEQLLSDVEALKNIYRDDCHAAERALAEERERCAVIADSFMLDFSHSDPKTAKAIATAIRSGKPDGKE